MSDLRTEVLVVGSGPGGAVAATVLTEAGLDVTVVEEGPRLPLESAPHFSREEIVQKYRNAGINVTMGGARVAWVEGRCVGGGSEVNRGLYHRTPDDVLEAWRRQFWVDALTPDELRPHFEACEAIAHVSHLPGEAPAPSLKLRDGARRLGWQWAEVPRLIAYSPDGSSGWTGRKQSMTETFIPRFIGAGGRLLPDVRVKRLHRRSGRWRVEAELTGSHRSIEICADTVVLACGAVQTPVLLRRSGLLHNGGGLLRFHPMVKVVASFPDEVHDPSGLEPVHQVKEFDPRFSMGCSISKRPALALALADRPELLPEVDRNWRRMAIYYVQSTGGAAAVRTLPFFRDPLLLARRNPADLSVLAEGLRRLAECLFAAGAEAIYPALSNVPILRSAGDLSALPTELPDSTGGITTMHLFASCPMGEDPGRCVTDSFGRVRGADGLYVADASVLCGPTIVNPQATVMAVAHRNAHRIAESRFCRPRAAVSAATT